MSEGTMVLRGPGGARHEFDEYNMTVVDGGRKYDVRDVTAEVFNHAFDATSKRSLSASDVHTASALASFINGYSQPGGIADIVCPPLLVSKASDYYYTWSKNNVFRRVNTLMSSEDAEPVEIGPSLSSTTYSVKPFGLSTFVRQGVEANADAGLQPRLVSLMRIMSAMAVEREHRVQTLLNNGTTFSGYTSTLTTSNYWLSGASADPLKDIHTAIETADMPITHIAMSRKSFHVLLRNPDVAKYSMYGGQDAAALSPDAMAQRLGLGGIQMVIGDMKSESSTQGTTTLSYIWDDDVFFLHIPPGSDANPEEIPTCRSFRWLKDGASRLTSGFRVREWDVPGRGQDGGRKLAVVCNEEEKVVAANTGYALLNVW